MKSITLLIPHPKAMEALGADLYRSAKSGMVICLSGDLGAGKTTLVRGFLRAMQYQGTVKSPTYTLVEPYELEESKVYHFDFYRLNDPAELEYMGVRDYFEEMAYCLIEWPEKAAGWLPVADLTISFAINHEERKVVINANTERGIEALQRLKHG